MFCIFRLGKRGSHRCIRNHDTVPNGWLRSLGLTEVEHAPVTKVGKQLQGKTLAEPYAYHP